MMNYLYFIQAENGPIKIGITGNVEKRLVSLKTHNPYDLTVLHVQLFDDMVMAREQEKSLHHRFQGCRINREWFKPSPELMEFIENINMKESLWRKMIALDGEIKRLYEDAHRMTFGPHECASRIWYEEFKPVMFWLVGFGRKTPPKEFCTTDAYEIAYAKIYQALPNCPNACCNHREPS